MDNAKLAKLRVTPGKLLPSFASDVTQYSVTVSSSIEEVRISYQTSDSGASCSMRGGKDDKLVKLIEGQISRIELAVTAEDGRTVKIYSVDVRRLSANDAILSELETSIGTLIPRFDPSTEMYCCYLPCSSNTIAVKATAEDQAMNISMVDSVTSMAAIPLSPGCTWVELKVCSANGKGVKHYVIKVIKRPIPYVMMLSSDDRIHLTCSVCWGVLYRPSRINRGVQMYCLPCLEELTRTNKSDVFTGQKLEGEWLIEDQKVEALLSQTQAVCRTSTGVVTGPIGLIGGLLNKQKDQEKKEEPTEICTNCSKKVPLLNMSVHMELLCPAKCPGSLMKQEVKVRPWEARLIDCTLGNDVQCILRTASAIETEYLLALPKGEQSSQELLQRAASCYATAAKLAPNDIRAHMGLALIMEELFYADDLYGIKKETEMDTEAEISADQEEFDAICKLHGINPIDGIVQQLKAIEAEYHSLKLSGQIHKAEHVQQLHAWKSKQASQVHYGSLNLETEGTIARAIQKLKDCVNINPCDSVSCFNLGRLSLLNGEYDNAVIYLKAALAIMPMFTSACLCLGLVLSFQNPAFSATLLYRGLSEYLATREHDCISNATEASMYKELLSKSFYRPTNSLIIEAFLAFAEIGGNDILAPEDSMALKHCKELHVLFHNNELPPTNDLRALQMQVCQTGVILQPNSSEALCHLGNAQLAEYEANSDVQLLKEAELNFKASISQEGFDIDTDVVPEELESQVWWRTHKKVQLDTHIDNCSTDKKSISSKETTASVNKHLASQSSKASNLSRQTITATVGKPTGMKTTKKLSGAKTASKPSGGTSIAVTKPSGASIPPKAVTKPSGTPIPPKAVTKSSSTSIPPKTITRSCSTSIQQKTLSGTSIQPKAVTKTSTTSIPPMAVNKQPAQAIQATAIPKISNGNTVNLSTGDQLQVDGLSPSQISNSSPHTSPACKEKNTKSHLPRLGMARALVKLPECNSKAITLYREVIEMAPELHEAYIELGAILNQSEPLAAVDVYCSFPFPSLSAFDDAFLHGEVVRILMNAEKYDDIRLCNSLISLGKAMGIGMLEKTVTVLEAKFKTPLLKQVYAGVHGKPQTDPDLQQFFKFKCW
ncbi:hypothetical protein EMCRGX_G032317 [Ephydatia muelleri]